ncbi:uncharacterized protein LOC131232222 [Magnolia sinica]|uniref:uncharacterized protein LOC131232222 n=1 Tax=Magnolia sinica TaxID=86752 RepID=UPI002657DA55|nr:uncharacterized protein LOC131232222 [Magnolia sinica]
MMGINSDNDEDRFFDSREEVTSTSDSGSDCIDGSDLNWVFGKFRFGVWIGNPDSVHERRSKFLEWTGLDLDLDRSESDSESERKESVDPLFETFMDVDRITETSGAVLRNSGFEDEFLSSRSSMSSWSSGAPDLSSSQVLEEDFVCRIRNLDDGTEFVVDELGQDGTLSRFREVGSNRLYTVDEFQRVIGLPPFIQQFMQREAVAASNSVETVKRRKKGWLRRLGAMACLVDRQEDEEGQLRTCDLDTCTRVGTHRVRVRSHRKRSKEFSALFVGQEIQAHVGSILTMKFSTDGQYLASAGEDSVVRVWKVMECARTDEADIPDADPSCLYFRVNNSSELVPVFGDKEKMCKFRGLRKMSDSACVIFPPKFFRISEEPLHEFRGHSGNVLDLSWSKNKLLLSSSEDKTVRLWQVGRDRCIKVFSHNNYVTCVQFNPADDNYFISGSIDGKVRIWSIPGCHVVDWIDVKEIVTAVCYQPDGQGGIVGSMGGICRFYDASGNHLQLYAQICLQGKKKSPCRRITGFQFCPSDPSKVMVTSADSQVRILDGVDVICKYRGIRSSGGQMSASFTSDGKHIISTSEDSTVYVWSHDSLHGPTSRQVKSIRSCERFFSSNASVAIPWSGMKSKDSDSCSSGTLEFNPHCFGDSTGNFESSCHWHSDSLHNALSMSSLDSFSLGHAFFSEAIPKGSATWPEEKLPASSSLFVPSSMCKSQYKFLKASCQNMVVSPHAWGLVIITAGWDGRIRSFHNYGLAVGF